MSSDDDYELDLLWEAIDRLLEPFSEITRAQILPFKRAFVCISSASLCLANTPSRKP
jgi:hypothetical protein